MRLLANMEFGPLAPDQPDLNNPGLELARNVLPRLRGYDSLPKLTQYGTGGLPSRCVGAFSAKDATDTSYLFAGTETQLWQLTAGAWVDASRAPAYNSVPRRWFTKFNDLVIAFSKVDRMQALVLGASQFDDLITEDIFGAVGETVRSFVVIGDVTDSDGDNPYRVRWSPIDNPAGDWSPSPTTLAGFQDLSGVGGRVLYVAGGEFGIVFRERALHRMTFVGSPVVWQFDEIDPGIGTLSGGSVVRHGARVFFLSEDGFRMTAGDASTAIGEERVDISVLSDLDQSALERITGAVYTDEQLIMWAYPGPGNVGGQPNRLAIYNYGIDRWAVGDEAVDILFKAAVPFRSIDGFDDDPAYGGTQTPALYASLEDIPGSLDDKTWSGGGFQLGAIDSDKDLAFFTGAPRAAQFETGERQLTPGGRTFISEMRSEVNIESLTVGPPAGAAINSTTTPVEVEIGSRASQKDPITWAPALVPNDEGFIPVRNESRYHRFRVTVPNGFDSAVGLQIYGEPAGGR